MNDTLINIGIYATYALIGICVLAILIFAVTRIVTHPGAAKSALIGIVALVVLGGISYAISNGSDANGLYADLEVTEGTSHMVGTGLLTFYLLIGIAVLSIIYVEITRLFK